MNLERAAAIAALAIVGLLSKKCYDDGKRREGALAERLQYVTDTLRDERARTDSIRRQYRVDTIRLTRWATRRDTLLVRVDSLLTLHDTVRVPVAVVRELKVTDDSVIAACNSARRTCEAETASLRRRLTLTEQQRDVYRAQRPSALSTWFWRAVALELGRLSAGKFP